MEKSKLIDTLNQLKNTTDEVRDTYFDSNLEEWYHRPYPFDEKGETYHLRINRLFEESFAMAQTLEAELVEKQSKCDSLGERLIKALNELTTERIELIKLQAELSKEKVEIKKERLQRWGDVPEN